MPAPESSQYLILVKHALPQIEAQVEAHHWHLSDKGKKLSEQLAPVLARYQPARLFSSPEPKALETAQILALQLNLPLQVVNDLHEHLRTQVGFMEQHRFEEAVQALFAHPAELVLGEETAQQALERFSRALESCLQCNPCDTLVVVSHGTVISLYLQANCGVEAYETWRRLELPSFVVFSLPERQLMQLVDNPFTSSDDHD